jgi:ornithine decarboxylase
MDAYPSAADFVRHNRPENPVLGLRPHAAHRAARWFLDNFPGRVIYAAKANDAAPILSALSDAGVTSFDVASTPEIERMAQLPDARLYYMNPVKSRRAIARAYSEFGVRAFSLDSAEELDKILDATGHARDLELYVRLSIPNAHALIPLEGKFGVEEDEAPALLLRTRQVAARLGVTFHVGSQAVIPASFGEALGRVDRIIRAAGVFVDAVDVGGGFPSRYPHSEPPPLSAYVDEIAAAWENALVSHSAELMCEPGRALVAEAESVIVRIDARRGDALYVNDGSYGSLYDATHCGFLFPARLIPADGRAVGAAAPFSMFGPTCDSDDVMPGPFTLPSCAREGDYIEIGQVGAYGRVMATRFNGYGVFDEVLLEDAPMLSAYPAPEEDAALRRAAG